MKEGDVTEQRALIVSNPLAPTNFAEAKAFADTLAKSDFVPTAFRNKPGDILAAIQMGAEVGLAPMAALQNIAVINGRPTIWGDAVPGIAMTHKDFESLEETFNESTMTATCKLKRRGSPMAIRTFSQKDAETAGLWGKNTWKQYPKRMLQMRARGFAMRDVFPDALKGLITREEAQDYDVKIVNAEPARAEPIHAEPVAEQPEPPPPSQAGSASQAGASPGADSSTWFKMASKNLEAAKQRGAEALHAWWFENREGNQEHCSKPEWRSLCLQVKKAKEDLGITESWDGK